MGAINEKGFRDHGQQMSLEELREYSGLNKNKPGKRSSMKHEEDVIHIGCISLFNKKYPYLWRCLYMAKNDGEKKKIQDDRTGKWFSPSALRDKAKGLVPGISDIEMIIPNAQYTGWHIELKTKTGTQSPEQKIFQLIAENFGRKYSIIRSVYEFEHELDIYMATVSRETMSKILALENAFAEIFVKNT